MHRAIHPVWPSVMFVLAIGSFFYGLQLSGCASNPVTAARDTEQRAYAVYGLFVIVEEQGAHVLSSPGVAGPVASAIRVADARAKPSADALLQAVRDYDAAVAALKSGTTTADKLTVASTNLQQWVARAQNDVNALVAAVKQGS